MPSCENDAPDLINNLPEELLLYIFRLLPLETILECENVCRLWRKLSRDVTLWRRIVLVYSGKPGQSDVSSKNLEIIQSHADYICCLKLQYIYNYPELKTILDKCNRLISLELVMCRIGKGFEEDVKRWPHLKKLNLKNSLLLQANDTISLEFDQFKDLNYLSLSDFGLTVNNCDTLINCAHLSHILIEKIKNLNLECIRDLILSKMKILKTFHIYGADAVDDECIQLLSQCRQLKDLAIIRCESLTDAGLIALVNCQNLQHLQIWNNVHFSELNLLKTLGSPTMVKLQSLSLSRIRNIAPVIVDVISEYYKNLKFLAVYQCPRIINTDYEKQLKSKFRNIDVVLY